MSCPVKDTLTSYLIKEKIIGKNNKVLVGSEELFDSLEVLNNYAKNEFGIEGNILKLKSITEDGLQYTSIEVDDKIAFEIDSKKGLYDSEASNKFRKTPPSGDNFVEIINYEKRYLSVNSLLNKTIHEINLQFENAKSNLEVATDNLETSRLALLQAQENYEIVKNRFNEGISTTTDLTDANYLLTQAKQGYNRAYFDKYLAISTLDRIFEINKY